MWNNLRITTKLPAFVIAVAVATGIGIGVASDQNAASTLKDKVNEELDVITNSRVAELKSYLGTIVEDVSLAAASPMTAKAIEDLGAGYRALGPNASTTLKDAYIKANPHPAGSRHKLDAAPSGTAYDTAHATYHPYMRKLLETRGYYDIFLFDASGELVYTVFKEDDFATNFKAMNAPWAGTDLGTVFRTALAGKPGTIAFSDFKAYAPSNNAPASFIATPVVVDNRVVGVVAFQMPVDKINAVMNGKIGLGQTGETLLVGADGLMRSDSSFTPTSDVLATRVDLDAVSAAIRGERRHGEGAGYRATDMTVVAAPLEFLGTRWAVVTVQATQEAFAALVTMRTLMLSVALAIIALAGVIGVLVARSLTRPIASVVQGMTALAGGHTDINLDAARRGDEIGDMTRAVSVFRDNALERQRLEAQQAADRARDEERQRRIETLIQRFRGDVGGLLSTVDTNMTAMTGVAQMLTRVAEFTTDRAVTCAAASEEASSNVQTVASAAEELSASIQEISRQLGRTSEMVGRATADARSTNDRVAALAASARRIGDVVELIRAIADQTNLLALNATIEAARAGDAGRGFAVVAQEVKALANQTGKATADIGDQISAIQSETEAAVNAIQAMARMMEDVNGTATSIAAAVEEQEAATQEISRNVQQASMGTRNVASNVSGVSDGAQETRQAAGQVATSSQDAADRARDLRVTVDRFLDAVAAA